MTTIAAGPDCIGPIRISRSLAHQLDGLTAGVAADALAPFRVCATELAQIRNPRDSPPARAQVIRERRDPVAASGEPVNAPVEARISFRTALRLAAAQPPAPYRAPGPMGLTIVISVDGERMYVERTSTQTSGTDLTSWAQHYLELLNALADQPDALAIVHASPGSDEVPVLVAW